MQSPRQHTIVVTSLSPSIPLHSKSSYQFYQPVWFNWKWMFGKNIILFPVYFGWSLIADDHTTKKCEPPLIINSSVWNIEHVSSAWWESFHSITSINNYVYRYNVFSSVVVRKCNTMTTSSHSGKYVILWLQLSSQPTILHVFACNFP